MLSDPCIAIHECACIVHHFKKISWSLGHDLLISIRHLMELRHAKNSS